MADKRFYWLKLKRDFFKRHDIQIIEDMPNGKEYILFYLKLLCESVDHDGSLRFSEQIPYNENMLATITRTNVDIVRAAIQVFTGLNMMEIMDDGTFFMSEVHKMLGSAVDNDNANRQRRFRERQKQLALQERYDGVTKNNERSESEIESESESESESEYIPPIIPPLVDEPKAIAPKQKKQTKRKTFVPPTIEEVREYVSERNSPVDPVAFWEYYDAGQWQDSKGEPVRNWKQKLLTWEKRDKQKAAAKPKSFADMWREEVENETL